MKNNNDVIRLILFSIISFIVAVFIAFKTPDYTLVTNSVSVRWFVGGLVFLFASLIFLILAMYRLTQAGRQRPNIFLRIVRRNSFFIGAMLVSTILTGGYGFQGSVGLIIFGLLIDYIIHRQSSRADKSKSNT